jgi:hypothetical protein
MPQRAPGKTKLDRLTQGGVTHRESDCSLPQGSLDQGAMDALIDKVCGLQKSADNVAVSAETTSRGSG